MVIDSSNGFMNRRTRKGVPIKNYKEEIVSDDSSDNDITSLSKNRDEDYLPQRKRKGIKSKRKSMSAKYGVGSRIGYESVSSGFSEDDSEEEKNNLYRWVHELKKLDGNETCK